MLTLARLLTNLLTPYLDQRFNQLERLIMALQDEVNALTAQVKKGTSEILNKIAELEAANPNVDLTDLKAAAQALDDVVPDAPAEEPPAQPA